MEYDRQVSNWNEAVNARKWVDKRNKENIYDLIYNEFYDKNQNETVCYIELRYKNNGNYAGHSAFINVKYKSVFTGLIR